MMATTHVFVGTAIAAAAALLFPEVGLPAVIGAAVGGAAPDLDLYAGHRRTLHYPVYSVLLAVPALLIAAVTGGPLLWAAALFLAAAAVHSIMDAAGGGLELRPWRGTSDRAVYSHYHERWVSPRRWIRYDGAPEDLALGAAAAVPALLVFEGPVVRAILVLLALSVGYAIVRKPMVAVAEWLYARAPEGVRNRLPDRFLEEGPEERTAA